MLQLAALLRERAETLTHFSSMGRTPKLCFETYDEYCSSHVAVMVVTSWGRLSHQIERWAPPNELAAFETAVVLIASSKADLSAGLEAGGC